MHIAAYMAALEVDDLDHHAKMALLMVCGRANRHTAAAMVSARRMATDMKVHRNTAWAALDQARKKGYLSVEKCLGKTSRWSVNLHNLGVVPAQQLKDTPAQSGCATKDSWRSTKDAFVAALPANPWIIDEDTGVAYRAGTLNGNGRP